MTSRILREKKTIEIMITLYCKSKHNSLIESSPCKDCSLLMNYAFKRLDVCRFGSKKPICGKCKIHCYKPDMRESIRIVMRTTGPKLILKHPIITLFHIIDSIRF